jgi:hypothetical protein
MTIVEELRVLLNSAEEAILIVGDIVKLKLKLRIEEREWLTPGLINDTNAKGAKS